MADPGRSGRPYLRRVLTGAVASSAGTAWSIVLGIATLPLVLDGLGSTQFGTYAVLQLFNSTSGYWSIVTTGVGVAGARSVATLAGRNDAAAAARSGGATVLAAAAAGAIGALVLFVAGPSLLTSLLGDNTANGAAAARWFGLLLAAEQVAASVQYVFEGHQRVDLSRLLDGLRRTVVIGALTTSAVVSGELHLAVRAGALAATMWLFVLIGVAGIRKVPLFAFPRRHDLVDIVRSARGVAGLTTLGVAHRTMDRFLGAALFGPRSVAVLEVTTQVQNAATAVLSSTSYVAIAATPWLESREDEEGQRALLLKGSLLVVLATTPVALLLAFLARPLLSVWLSGGGQQAAELVPIAMAFVLLSSPLQVASNMLLGRGRAGAVARAAVPALLVNLAASWVLSLWLGLAGLLIGSVIGAIVLAPLLFSRVRQIVPVTAAEFVGFIGRPALTASLPMAGILAIVVILDRSHTALAGGAVLASVVYGGLAWTGLPEAMRDDLRSLVRGRAGSPSTAGGNASEGTADDSEVQRE